MISIAHGAHQRSRLWTAGLAVLALACASHPLPGQHAHESTERDSLWLLARARAAATRFIDRREAIAEGYKRVGPDFPFMGEHWVQPGLLVSGGFDVDQTPVLTYALINDAPVLTGVAYALPLGTGEILSRVPVPHGWHDHTGSVDEESSLIHSVLTKPSRDAPRLAMLHVWIGVTNPLGDFAQDNLAIPFARNSLRAPIIPERTATRALSLAGDGERYYRWMLRSIANAAGREGEVIDSAVQRAAAQVDQLLTAHRPSAVLSEERIAQLTAIWRALFADLRHGLPPAMMERLDPLARADSAGH